MFPVDSWEEDDFAYLGSEIICREDSVTFRQKPYIENRLFTVDLPWQTRTASPTTGAS